MRVVADVVAAGYGRRTAGLGLRSGSTTARRKEREMQELQEKMVRLVELESALCRAGGRAAALEDVADTLGANALWHLDWTDEDPVVQALLARRRDAIVCMRRLAEQLDQLEPELRRLQLVEHLQLKGTAWTSCMVLD